ncbi:MAG: GDSL-type esterase/lipase family protein [Thermoanaerobaculia bacterium]|nr:GDSL-type esterase/lipase family protein [Thermoanaerobaculia bacterium]
MRSGLLGATLAAGLLAALAASPATADDFTVAAFGDSITQGSCCPQVSPYDYQQQLAASLSASGWCAPDTCSLHNRGLAAEETSGGITRLRDTVLPNPPAGQTWDLVLLMEGTNDIFNGRPISAIKANLLAMDEDAIEVGVDVLHASVIQFHPWVSDATQRPASCTQGGVKNWAKTWVTNLRTEIISYTAARNRYFADQASELCPAGTDRHGHSETTCFSLHYNEKCVVGHPGNDGFDMLGLRFFETMTASPKPAAPTVLTPAGGAAFCGDPPTFDFTKGAGEHATFYEIDIDSGAWREWLQEVDFRAGEPDLCQPDSSPDNDCSLASPLAHGDGAHQWRVRGRNPGGFGPWSAVASYTVATSPTGPVTTLTAPAGCQGGNTPSFTWGEIAGATSYRLLVELSGGGTVHDQTYAAGAVCAGSVCTASPGLSLASDVYTWKVRALNPCEAPWSASQGFTVPPATAPSANSPSGELVIGDPVYRWSSVPGASDYELEVREDGSPQALTPAPPYAAGSTCAGALCQVQPSSPTLSVGPGYTWKVRALEATCPGPWSAERAMERVSCDATDPLVQESATVTTVQAPVRGCGELRAGNVTGAGDFVVGNGGDVTHHAAGPLVLYNGFSVLTGGAYTGRADR